MSPRTLTRSRNTLVRGIRTAIDCPAWCITAHETERLNSLADLAHVSDDTSFGQPADDTEPGPVASANLFWMPNVAGGEARLLVWPSYGDAASELNLATAERLLAELQTRVDQLRAAQAVTG